MGWQRFATTPYHLESIYPDIAAHNGYKNIQCIPTADITDWLTAYFSGLVLLRHNS